MSRQRSIVRLTRMALLSAAGTVAAGPLPPAQVPAAIRTPPGESVVLVAHATGAQVYVCAAAPDGTFQWTLKGPAAALHDAKGELIGHHFAGPAWKLKDGSEVTGKATAHVDPPDSHALPWLLLSVVSHAGGGALAAVTHIQRIHTQGGEAPPAAQCDAARRNSESRSAYSADYYFYAPEGEEPPQGSPY